MKQGLSWALDESLALLMEGQVTLEECLARYPEYSSELRPLLETFLQVQSLEQPTSSTVVFVDGKRRMLKALAEKKQRQEQVSLPAFLQGVQSVVSRFRNGDLGRMRAPAFRTALTVALTLVLIAFAGLLIRSLPGGVVDQVASVTHVSGIVEILPAGSQTWQLVLPGGQVEAGDRIRTGPQSAAMLAFSDGIGKAFLVAALLSILGVIFSIMKSNEVYLWALIYRA